MRGTKEEVKKAKEPQTCCSSLVGNQCHYSSGWPYVFPGCTPIKTQDEKGTVLAIESVQMDLIRVFALLCCKGGHGPLYGSSSNVHGRGKFHACQIHGLKPPDYMTFNSRPSHLCNGLCYSTRLHLQVIPAPGLWFEGLLHGIRVSGLKSACPSGMCMLGGRLLREIVTSLIENCSWGFRSQRVSETQCLLTCPEESPDLTD